MEESKNVEVSEDPETQIWERDNWVCWHRNYGDRRQMLLGAFPITGLKIETRGCRNTCICASFKFIDLTAGPFYAHWSCHCGCRFSYLKQLLLYSSQYWSTFITVTTADHILWHTKPFFFGIITNKLCHLFLLLLILLILCKCMKFNGTHILHIEYAYSLLTILTLIFT